jgi:hypothetical protein
MNNHTVHNTKQSHDSCWEQVPEVIFAEVDLDALIQAYVKDQDSANGDEEGDSYGHSLDLEQEVLAFYSSIAASVGWQFSGGLLTAPMFCNTF